MARILKPGGRLVMTDMDSHPYTWLKDEMADEWLGFERAQVRAWLRQAGLVNTIVAYTGQSCCAESQSMQVSDEKGRSAKIDVFVASATRPLNMQEAVQERYAQAAQGSNCWTPKAQQEIALNSTRQESCCGESQEDSVQDFLASIYSESERAEVPEEAEEISLGCGNPVAVAGLKAGESVLDIGSGGGMDSFLAAARVGPAGQVIGVDMTPAMLARARASAARTGISNVEFRQGYAEAMPVEDGTVDVVMSNCVINLTEDKGRVFGEAFRALRPGGRLEVSDIVTSGAMPLEALEDRESWAECVSGALPEQEYLDLIAQAGFTEIEVRQRTRAGSLAGVSITSAIVKAVKPAR